MFAIFLMLDKILWIVKPFLYDKIWFFFNLSERASTTCCFVTLSNHNTKLINELYSDYNIHIIEAKRNINSNGKKRGNAKEVIITNYTNNKTF